MLDHDASDLDWLKSELLARGWGGIEESEPEPAVSPARVDALPGGAALPALAGVVVLPDAERNLLASAPDVLDPQLVLAQVSKHLRSIGRVNILVAGQTGVGKSTLINNVFGEDFAATAAGMPVTQYAAWYSSDKIPLRILDTKGLEAKDYDSTVADMRAEIERCRGEADTRDQLHIAWVCISTPSSRVQPCEISTVRLLNSYNIPVIIVLTKDDEDPDFPQIVARVMNEKQAQYEAVTPVRALARRSTPAFGLENLVSATYRVLPQAHRAAFAAAQKVSRELNKSAADEFVMAAVTAAAAASVIPIPFADVLTLLPIQAGMLIGISSAFNLNLDKQQTLQIVTATMGSLAATLAGRWAVGSALKFIPGPGSVIGGVLNAAIAGTLTRAMGKAYIRFLYDFLEVNGRVPRAEEILLMFPKLMKGGASRQAG